MTVSPKSYSDGCLTSTSSVKTEFLVGTTATKLGLPRIAPAPDKPFV